MRAPYQVLVFPYRTNGKDLEYAIFSRSDCEAWQGIAGGGEDGEDKLTTAKRETFEESGIKQESNYIILNSQCTIPVEFVTGEFTWGKDVYVIPEYAFGVDATGQQITTSKEHKTYKWTTYNEAIKLLKWDSNSNALWELNKLLEEKIKNK